MPAVVVFIERSIAFENDLLTPRVKHFELMKFGAMAPHLVEAQARAAEQHASKTAEV